MVLSQFILTMSKILLSLGMEEKCLESQGYFTLFNLDCMEVPGCLLFLSLITPSCYYVQHHITNMHLFQQLALSLFLTGLNPLAEVLESLLHPQLSVRTLHVLLFDPLYVHAHESFLH